MIGCFTKTGTRHVRHGKDCEDASFIVRVGIYIIMIVLDGCSGSRAGGVGAYRIGKYLVRFFTEGRRRRKRRHPLTREALCAYLMQPGKGREFVDLIVSEARHAVEDLCIRDGGDPTDYYTTLRFAIVREDPDPDKDSEFLLMSVGDGFAALNGDGCTQLFDRGFNFEGIPNLTYFVNCDDAEEYTVAYGGSCRSLLLSTDGLTAALGIDRDCANLDRLMTALSALPDGRRETLRQAVLSLPTEDGTPLEEAYDLYDDLGVAYYHKTDRDQTRDDIIKENH